MKPMPEPKPGQHIFRAVHRENFTVLPNELLRDSSLSYKARGILAMLLSNHDDWVVHASFVEERGKEGREAISAGMRELESAGYLIFVAAPRGDAGKFQGGSWLVYDQPRQADERTNKTRWREFFENSAPPTYGKPGDGQPTYGKPQDGKPGDGFPTAKKNYGEEELSQRKNNAAAANELPLAVEKPKQAKLDIPDDLPDFPAATMMRVWNTFAPSLRKLNGISGERNKLARARWKDLGGNVGAWEQFVKRVETADKLTGRFRRANTPAAESSDWKADFDWCIQPGNFLKITEGKYDNPTPKPNQNAKRFF